MYLGGQKGGLLKKKKKDKRRNRGQLKLGKGFNKRVWGKGGK